MSHRACCFCVALVCFGNVFVTLCDLPGLARVWCVNAWQRYRCICWTWLVNYPVSHYLHSHGQCQLYSAGLFTNLVCFKVSNIFVCDAGIFVVCESLAWPDTWESKRRHTASVRSVYGQHSYSRFQWQDIKYEPKGILSAKKAQNESKFPLFLFACFRLLLWFWLTKWFRNKKRWWSLKEGDIIDFYGYKWRCHENVLLNHEVLSLISWLLYA